MVDYGMKITKIGKAITSINPVDYVLWSKYPIMKTYIVGTYSYTFPSDFTDVEIVINHNLGYRPFAWLSINGPYDNAKTTDWWAYYYNVGGDKVLRAWRYKLTNTEFKIVYSESNGAGNEYNPTGETWYFKYYIFIEGELSP